MLPSNLYEGAGPSVTNRLLPKPKDAQLSGAAQLVGARASHLSKSEIHPHRMDATTLGKGTCTGVSDRFKANKEIATRHVIGSASARTTHDANAEGTGIICAPRLIERARACAAYDFG